MEINASDPVQAKRWSISTPQVINIFLVCSVLLNLLLAWKIKSLESSLLSIKAEGVLAVGTLVPSIEARDIDDRPAKITYLANEPPTVLYIFTPPCKWCAHNLENIRTLAEQAKHDYRFIGLSLSSNELRDYVKDNNLGFPVYSGMSHVFSTAYKVGGTPETLVISPEGRVLKNWKGAYMNDVQKEIEQYFKVSLPGISK
jgi:peroxiredoxin